TGAHSALLPAVGGVDDLECEAAEQALRQRTADVVLGLDGVEAAIAGQGSRLEFLGRFAGDVVDQAAGGVAPVQGALRALEYLHPFDVQIRAARHDAVRQIDLVDVGTHRAGRRIGSVGEADAA